MVERHVLHERLRRPQIRETARPDRAIGDPSAIAPQEPHLPLPDEASEPQAAAAGPR